MSKQLKWYPFLVQTLFTLLLTSLFITGCCSDQHNPLLSNRDHRIHYYTWLGSYSNPQCASGEINKEELTDYRYSYYKIVYNSDSLPETVEKWSNNNVTWRQEYFYENSRLVRSRITSDQKVKEIEIKYNGCKAVY